METRTRRRLFGVAALLALLVAVLLVSSRLFLRLAWLILRATWPGLFILCADETQERCVYCGGLILFGFVRCHASSRMRGCFVDGGNVGELHKSSFRS